MDDHTNPLPYWILCGCGVWILLALTAYVLGAFE